ncbi:cupin domain-containing protein [Butyrivibrio sp. LC3010]|uniref:cupin domain-containing protein n=1 Tax=Butyrivibrio sp. LC3010 TaxID=1280680 RepID=UPI0003FC575D|nr:cupin domain-containing protein [Butyrivibrio sp. LC3010]
MDFGRIEKLKTTYCLEAHPEGGWFSECYTSKDEKDSRSLAGSIYFLLAGDEISHFHQIDCDEIWYHHEGCAVKITVITGGHIGEYLLGQDIENGERAMVVIPKGAIFAAENLDKNSYCFMSCATTPKFRYEGFRLVGETEMKEICGKDADKILYLAYRG